MIRKNATYQISVKIRLFGCIFNAVYSGNIPDENYDDLHATIMLLQWKIRQKLPTRQWVLVVGMTRKSEKERDTTDLSDTQ